MDQNNTEQSFRIIAKLYTGMLGSLRPEVKQPSKSLFGSQQPAYSFTAEEAVAALQRPNHAESSLGAPVSPQAAKRLLTAFSKAHLLHNPVDRPAKGIWANTWLQPTAKGLAIAQRICRESGTHDGHLLPLLCTAYNSLRLVRFERDPLGSKILISPPFVSYIWSQMLGPSPNIYDQQPTSSYFVSAPDVSDVLGDIDMFNSAFNDFASTKQQNVISPYYHRYFLHPSSSATSQYFESHSGVRLFSNVSFKFAKNESQSNGDDTSSLKKLRSTKSWKFGRKNDNIAQLPLVVTGKSLWQWLMDCTDIFSGNDAARIVQEFVEARYVLPVDGECMDNICCEDDLPKHCSRETFYTFSANGLSISAWQPDMINNALSFDVNELPSRHQREHKGSSGSESSCISQPTLVEHSFAGLSKPVRAVSPMAILPNPVKNLSSVEEFRYSLKLDTVIKEPGLCAIFREELMRVHAEENILYCDGYARLKQCQERLNQSLKLEQGGKECTLQIHACLDELETLSKNFFFTGAPQELNISGRERAVFEELALFKQQFGQSVEMIPHMERAFTTARQIHDQVLGNLTNLLEQILQDDKLATQLHHHYVRPLVSLQSF